MTPPVEQMLAALRAEPYRIRDAAVLSAMADVPREHFVPESWKHAAYEDRALPIGYGQTVSQPFIVATMLTLAELTPKSRVLEIGTGTGYQAALLAQLADQVFSVEIVGALAAQAKANLEALDIRNAFVRHGDGRDAWIEKAPFDAILVACAATQLPKELKSQLADGGRLVYPAGDDEAQALYVLKRNGENWSEEKQFAVRFVPMTNELR